MGGTKEYSAYTMTVQKFFENSNTSGQVGPVSVKMLKVTLCDGTKRRPAKFNYTSALFKSTAHAFQVAREFRAVVRKSRTY